MVERGREPLKDWWSLPGGVVETGERLETALRREVREETGLEVEIVCPIEVFERIMLDEDGKPEYHYVLMDYICRPAGGHAAGSRRRQQRGMGDGSGTGRNEDYGGYAGGDPQGVRVVTKECLT